MSLIKNEFSVNRFHLKLSADLSVGKLLQTTKSDSMKDSNKLRFRLQSELMGWLQVINSSAGR